MGFFLWVDSKTGPAENNGQNKVPWCSRPSKITWCLPNEKCGNKLTCGRNMVKSDARQKQCGGEKSKAATDALLKTGKAKIPESKVACHRKKNSEKGKSKDAVSSHWKEYGAVVAVSFACYANALLGDFVHDDIPAIMHNRDVTGQTPLSEIFGNDFWGAPMSDPSSHKSYRPLTTLSFRATHALVGLQPLWFHMCNVLLHATASVLFTRVCLAIVGFQPEFAAIAGALFAAHPIHTEAVTGIVGQADVLACVFFLLSFLMYHREANKSSVWISIVLASLSMLAKETGIMVLLLNMCYDCYKSWRSIKRTLNELKWNEDTIHFSRRAAKVLMSLSLLLVFRLALLQGSLPKFSNQDNPAAFHPCRHVRFLTFCFLAALNCWLLLFPATLSHDWQMGSVPLVTCIADSRNLATCLFFGCLAVLIYKGILDFEHQRHPPLVLGLSLLVLPFLPATNIAVTVGFVVAERILYIPSLGWTILVVYGLQLLRLKHKSVFVTATTVFVIFAFCSRSLIRNKDWSSRESLIRSGLKSLPHNAKMHYNFANFLRDTGNVDSAAAHYKEALRLWPTYASAHNNLGTLMSGPEEAELHFLAAIRYSPHHVNAHYNLGQVYRKVNRTTEALSMLERCVTLDGSYTPAYMLMAKLHALAGRDEIVGQLLHHITLLHPENPDNLAEYASWLHTRGLTAKSLYYYERALGVLATHRNSLLGAARILRSRGQWPRVHRIIIRSHIMARAKRGSKIYTGDLYFRSWQLQSQFLQLSKSDNNDNSSKSFVNSSVIKKLEIQMAKNVSLSEESPAVNNSSAKLSPLPYKNFKSARKKTFPRKNIVNKTLLVEREINSKPRCSLATAEYSTTKIRIMQDYYNRFGWSFGLRESRSVTHSGHEDILCLGSVMEKLITEEKEVPT